MTENTQNILDLIEDTLFDESNQTPTEDKINKLSVLLDEQEKFSDALPEIKKVYVELNEKIAGCDKNIKIWQESKKMWKGRSDSILSLLQTTMEKFKMKMFTAQDCKVSLRKSEKLVTDDDAILSQFQAFADALRNQLPSFVKVSLTIDKTELKNYLKTDNTLMVNYPQLIHSEENISVNLK